MKMRTKKLTTLILTFILMINSSGFYTGDAKASPAITEMNKRTNYCQVTPDQAVKGGGENTEQKLEFGKRQEGRLLPDTERQNYKLTLKSSGKLTIHLEGDIEKLAVRLTDEKGKGWGPRGTTEGGKYTYQLKKGTYHYQVKAREGTVIAETGLDYAITARFQSAKAKYENNTTRKQAVNLPLHKIISGHLAQNAPVEYYKIDLKRAAFFAFSITTQTVDKTPETFVVSLYNSSGKKIDVFENPDWIEMEKEFYDYYPYERWGDWCFDGEGEYRGMRHVLPSGTYYVGISVKRDENGRVPASARYGQYEMYASRWYLGVEVKLSQKTAEYTGKKIKRPKIILKEYSDDPGYEDGAPYDVKQFYGIYDMTRNKKVWDIREIGRYMIGGSTTSVTRYIDGSNARTIFTVTPVQGKINRVRSTKPGQIELLLKKNVPSTGYQIQIAKDRNFRKSRKTMKTLETNKTIKGLSSGKRYYVRMRNYKDVMTGYNWGYWQKKEDGTEEYCRWLLQDSIYGKWSKPRAIICK